MHHSNFGTCAHNTMDFDWQEENRRRNGGTINQRAGAKRREPTNGRSARPSTDPLLSSSTLSVGRRNDDSLLTRQESSSFGAFTGSSKSNNLSHRMGAISLGILVGLRLLQLYVETKEMSVGSSNPMHFPLSFLLRVSIFGDATLAPEDREGQMTVTQQAHETRESPQRCSSNPEKDRTECSNMRMRDSAQQHSEPTESSSRSQPLEPLTDAMDNRMAAGQRASNAPTDPTVSKVPRSFLSPFGSYPNPLQITESDRQQFEPIIQLPTFFDAVVTVKDLSSSSSSHQRQLATEEERTELANRRLKWIQQFPLIGDYLFRYRQERKTKRQRRDGNGYSVGRYDENRVSTYTSELFTSATSTSIDGYGNSQSQRTIHAGIDLGAPVGTPVRAFADGIVYHVGYNAPLGDYGNVIVIKHTLPWSEEESESRRKHQPLRVVYALYGHLDHSSIKNKVGNVTLVKKGQQIGKIGDFDENGGWFVPHVHFQVSTEPPITHDMPGAVSLQDRARALQQYFDPRYIVGPLY
jgi:peptidoglycan LD-endopeptidase LytH